MNVLFPIDAIYCVSKKSVKNKSSLTYIMYLVEKLWLFSKPCFNFTLQSIKSIFMPRCVLLLTLLILKIHFISDLSAHNFYFQSRQLLFTPSITFHLRFGAEKLLLRPETGV